jgi:hypothetical protein
VVIKRPNTFKDAILFSIKAGNCHIDVNTEEYRVIEISVLNDTALLSLLDSRVGGAGTSFINFKKEKKETASNTEMDRAIFKFSLFSSGKYHVDLIPCTKLLERKNSTILEYLFVSGIKNRQDASLYSLLECLKQKRKACYCEICWFHKKVDLYGAPESICMRYKTKGTPHYPLKAMPLDCPYFRLNKELESEAGLNYGNVNVIEKEYNT